ncbi:hypothetical protein BMR59_12465 [Escherichia coli]|uniref:Uncharacterized protein n=1 Tax=Escherichia coli TaxID=562 RepID=A0A0E1L3Q0_ECOLX|nr:hypothetical protein AC789_1c03220 [Escherichia coli]EFJ88101.1 hypothetical protein HMPREF9536_01555 [Escherichia coli MS 84-1]OYE75564.1 hypothetical protein CI631_17840 [Shigella sonnei]AQV39153.1 hypothetical protein BE959_02605 [Escherichia coli]ARA32497.1 hypothetical protein AM448_16230 [Escherichia coli]
MKGYRVKETNIALPHTAKRLLNIFQQKGEIRRIKFKRVLLSDYRCYSQFIENSHKNQGNVNDDKKSTCRLFIGCTTGRYR